MYGEKVSFEPFPWSIGLDDGEQQDIGLLLDTLDSLPPVKEVPFRKGYGVRSRAEIFADAKLLERRGAQDLPG